MIFPLCFYDSEKVCPHFVTLEFDQKNHPCGHDSKIGYFKLKRRVRPGLSIIKTPGASFAVLKLRLPAWKPDLPAYEPSQRLRRCLTIPIRRNLSFRPGIKVAYAISDRGAPILAALRALGHDWVSDCTNEMMNMAKALFKDGRHEGHQRRCAVHQFV